MAHEPANYAVRFVVVKSAIRTCAVAALLAVLGRPHTGHAQSAAGGATPYSTITFRGGAITTRTAEPLHTYYPGNHGIAFEIA